MRSGRPDPRYFSSEPQVHQGGGADGGRSRAAALLWLPWWSAGVGWGYDQIAAGSAAAMESYAGAYDGAVRSLVRAKRELYPEAVMWAHLHSLKTAGRAALRPLQGFRASLARGSPRLHLVDPYAKLKEDYSGRLDSLREAGAAPADSKPEPLPEWECREAAAAMGGPTHAHTHVGNHTRNHTHRRTNHTHRRAPPKQGLRA